MFVLPQFSVTEHFKDYEAGHYRTIPGVFFFYDLSPIKVDSLLDVMAFVLDE